MKTISRIILAAAVTALACATSTAYNDHRGHNLDSLERAVARWTPDKTDRASEEELIVLNRAYRDLMLGYNVINGEKCIFYARKALDISHPRGWYAADADAFRYLGQHFYGREQYDSAMVYYKASLACVERMEAGASSPTSPEGYPQRDIDDYASSLYGSIGNLYNMMDSIPQAMEWYAKAGELFERNGWNESNSVLWYNIGETWVEEGELRKAAEAYDKAMGYAQASGDSLMIVDVWKGFGNLYLSEGKTGKALSYLRKADAYYAAHPDHSPNFRTENLDMIKEALSRQKLTLGRIAGALVALLLVAGGVIVARRSRGRRDAGQDAGNGYADPEHSAAQGGGQAMLRRGHSRRDPSLLPEQYAAPASDAVALSDREKDILDLLSKGYTTRQIAEALHLSDETIRWYRKKMIAKFEVSNTPELISFAKEAGLI